MEYYVLEFDDKFDCLVDAQIPFEYEGISLNLATPFEYLSPIKLTSNTHIVPDCIPNNRRYIYFNSKIRQILTEFTFDKFQVFDVNIIDKQNNRIDTTHKLVNFLNVVSCIDRNNSVLQLEEDEEDEELNIVDIQSLKLDKTKLKDHLVFRLGGFETLLIFREDIAQAIISEKCTGLQFFNADGYRI